MCLKKVKSKSLVGVLGVGRDCHTMVGRPKEWALEEWKENAFELEHVTCI